MTGLLCSLVNIGKVLRDTGVCVEAVDNVEILRTKKLESAIAAAPYIGFISMPYSPMASGMQMIL